jgi:hypothetical protein
VHRIGPQSAPQHCLRLCPLGALTVVPSLLQIVWVLWFGILRTRN